MIKISFLIILCEKNSLLPVTHLTISVRIVTNISDFFIDMNNSNNNLLVQINRIDYQIAWHAGSKVRSLVFVIRGANFVISRGKEEQTGGINIPQWQSADNNINKYV